MRLPKSVIVNGKRWKVILKPLIHRHLWGQCLHHKREIQIDSGLSTAERQETFLHELMHACLAENLKMRTEEHLVERLSCRLLPVLKRLGWAP